MRTESASCLSGISSKGRSSPKRRRLSDALAGASDVTDPMHACCVGQVGVLSCPMTEPRPPWDFHRTAGARTRTAGRDKRNGHDRLTAVTRQSPRSRIGFSMARYWSTFFAHLGNNVENSPRRGRSNSPFCSTARCAGWLCPAFVLPRCDWDGMPRQLTAVGTWGWVCGDCYGE